MKIFLEISCFLDLMGSSPPLLHKILIQNPLQCLVLLSVELMPLQSQSVHCLLRYYYFGDIPLPWLFAIMQVERKTGSETRVPTARISSTSSFQNRIYEMYIRNTFIFQAAGETNGQTVSFPGSGADECS